MGIEGRDILRLLLLGMILAGAGGSRAAVSTPAAAAGLKGTRATYCSAPRKPDGRIDVDRLVSELVDVGANTYSFCIHVSSNDWQDSKLFLPAARAKGIRVWGSVVPPSESPPRTKMYAEPF